MNIIEPRVKLVISTPEQLIAHTSRACYQSFEKADEASDERLIKHFVQHGESPLEFAWAMFDVNCSYAAHVHLLRHRFFSFQWRSQRYDETFEWVLPPEHRLAGNYTRAYANAEEGFAKARSDGDKRQDARYVVPQGIAVQGFMAGNARAWQSFLELRTSKKAMPETRQVAELMRAELSKVWPTIFPPEAEA